MSILKQRRVYDREFKQEAVCLVIEEGLKAAEVERNLGIGKSTVSRDMPRTLRSGRSLSCAI
jgi:transposase-like protein